MAGVVSISCFYGASAGTESTTISGIDLISADNCTNNSTNRQDNPITAGNQSYEKYIAATVDSAPDNYVENFELWGDGSTDSNTTLFVGITATADTPASGDSTIATNDWTSYTASNKLTWYTSQMTGAGSQSDYCILQLDTGAGANPGDWAQETLNYSYDEA